MSNWTKEPLGRLMIRKILAWWHEPVSYPWPEELNAEVRQSEFICHHCCAPQEDYGWFCPECGAATGPYNNCLPYIHIFSIGEVARAGVGSKSRWTSFITFGFILFSTLEYFIFAPIYWARMYGNRKRWQRAHDSATE